MFMRAEILPKKMNGPAISRRAGGETKQGGGISDSNYANGDSTARL